MKVRIAVVALVEGALLAGAATPAPLHGQAARNRIFVALGVGSGDGYGGGGGAGVMAQVVYQRAPHHFALRGIALTDFPGSSDEGLGELGILYGRFAAGTPGYASAAIGVAGVYLDQCGRDNPRNCATVGIPLVAELAITPFDVFGIGLQIFGNVNPKTTYGGAFIYIPLGWMP